MYKIKNETLELFKEIMIKVKEATEEVKMVYMTRCLSVQSIY